MKLIRYMAVAAVVGLAGGLAAPSVAGAGTDPSWAGRSSPNSSLQRSELNGVSCSSATACTADGYSKNSSGADLTLAEHWNGTKWAVQSTPTPSGGPFGGGLAGVSCSSAAAC